MRKIVFLHLLWTLALSGCGLSDAFGGVRRPDGDTQQPTAPMVERPPLMLGSGGASKNEDFEVFIRPTSVSQTTRTLEGAKHRMRVLDVKPVLGSTR